MSILVEIAEKADVSVEGVVRVLTREPVSDAIKLRVLEVLDDLTPEQTRAVQRFALAALHDIIEQEGGVDPVDRPPAPGPDQLALPVAAAEPELLPTLAPDAALVQLSSVLGELAEAVRDLRRETDAERRERVDDLAVLIDLITTGWQGLDARLGRIERQVSRLESGRRESAISAPVRVAAAPVETPPAAVPPPVPTAPSEPVVTPAAEPSRRDRLPYVAALSLVGAGIVTLAVLQLASGRPDFAGLVDARESSSSTTGEIPASTAQSTTSQPPAQRPTAPATTSDVLGTTSAGTTRPAPPTATTAPRTTSARPPATTPSAATQPTTTSARPAAFKPTRNWAWAPVADADYYDVAFTRAGTAFYRATPAEPKLTLPGEVVFPPGSYRWVVRPGFGARSARNLGAPVVDSPFTVG